MSGKRVDLCARGINGDCHCSVVYEEAALDGCFMLHHYEQQQVIYGLVATYDNDG